MDYSADDLEIIEKIAAIKWGKNFRDYKCRKCGNKKYYLTKKPFETKCSIAKCATIESALSNTALADGKIPVSTKMNILFKIQNFYPERISDEDIAQSLQIQKQTVHNFLESLSQWYPQKWNDGDEIVNPKDDWYLQFIHGLTEESKDKYTSIFEIITYLYELRPIESMLEILVKKHSNYITP